MLDMIIQRGLVVTPEDVGHRDIGVQDGKIVAVAMPGRLTVDAARVIEAQGMIVLPGGIEPHAAYWHSSARALGGTPRSHDTAAGGGEPSGRLRRCDDGP